ADRVEDGPLVVVAQKGELAVHRQVQALARVGAVADHVAEAVDGFHVVLDDVVEHRLQRFEVAVDVAEDGLHRKRVLAGAGAQGSLAKYTTAGAAKERGEREGGDKGGARASRTRRPSPGPGRARPHTPPNP